MVKKTTNLNWCHPQCQVPHVTAVAWHTALHAGPGLRWRPSKKKAFVPRNVLMRRVQGVDATVKFLAMPAWHLRLSRPLKQLFDENLGLFFTMCVCVCFVLFLDTPFLPLLLPFRVGTKSCCRLVYWEMNHWNCWGYIVHGSQVDAMSLPKTFGHWTSAFVCS